METLEDIIKIKEVQLEVHASLDNREELKRAETELRRWLTLEEDFWQKKVGMKWLEDRD